MKSKTSNRFDIDFIVISHWVIALLLFLIGFYIVPRPVQLLQALIISSRLVRIVRLRLISIKCEELFKKSKNSKEYKNSKDLIFNILMINIQKNCLISDFDEI